MKLSTSQGPSLQENIPLAPYTIYKIGGLARFFAESGNADDLKNALVFAAEKKIPFFILGAGSNILVSDQGFSGLVIHMSGGKLTVDGCKLVVDASVMMARAVRESAKAGLKGLEWGIGIPGTVGGSVRGNAGCFGGEMKDVVEKVSIFNYQFSKIEELENSQCGFGYRDAVFKKHPEWIILSATIRLKKGDPKVIQKNIKRITTERTKKQDIGTKSCGCIFKNAPWPDDQKEKHKLFKLFPEFKQVVNYPNIPASFLVDRAGLKGKKAGRVFISPKHANFFVNDGGATAEEVMQLISITKEAVHQKYRILMKEEIQYVGFD